MTLAEIADASGIAARTIRFYIARGILNGPVKAGRGASYSAEHLSRLDRIKRLQAEGRTLSEIAGALSGHAPEPAAAAPTAWWQHAIADDIIVWVRAGASPWRMKQVRAAVDELARRLQQSARAAKREEEEI